MKLQTGDKNISFLGENLKDRVGDMDFTEKVPVIFSAVLDKNYSNSEILKIFNPSEMELGEIYSLLGTLPNDRNVLFLTRDKEGFSRFILAFTDKASDSGWRLAAPGVTPPPQSQEENPYWQKGILLISKTKI